MTHATAKRNRMAEENLGLAGEVASRFLGQGNDQEELFQAAAVGLIRAADSFDPAIAKFSSFAWAWCRKAIQRHLRLEAAWMHVPNNVFEEANDWTEAEARLAHRLGRFPTADEVLDELGVAGRVRERFLDARRVLDAGRTDPLASQPTVEGDGPPDRLIRDEEDGLLHEAMVGLPERHRRAVILRFGLGGRGPATLPEIGEDLGVSSERARQIVGEALVQLRKALESKGMAA